jgi:UPF0755 protein
LSVGRIGRIGRTLGCLFLLALAVAGGGAAWVGWRLFTPHRGYAAAEQTVIVPGGSDARQILAQLEAAGVLADATLARAYLVYVLDDPPLRAGEYLFRGPLNVPAVLGKLVRGEVVTHGVTLVEGLTLEEAAQALADAGFGQRDALLAAMRDPAPIAYLDPAARDLEGYLFPDTYAFARGTAERDIVAALVRTFRARFQSEVQPRLGGDTARMREIVTLASIVEEEAKLDAERGTIAAVYRNRLRIGMALYADPTIIFALKRRGTWDGNLRRRDLELEDPYNTYRHAGLPPGPICSPGLRSLLAAAAPADAPYLYFVSRNDGSHVFAETLPEHNRNVQTWQKR